MEWRLRSFFKPSFSDEALSYGDAKMFTSAMLATLFSNVAFFSTEDQQEPLGDRQYAVVKTLGNEPPVAKNGFGLTSGQGIQSTLGGHTYQLSAPARVNTIDNPFLAADRDNLLLITDPLGQVISPLQELPSRLDGFGVNFPYEEFAMYSTSSIQKIPGMDKKVSANFQSATVADVLKWVSKQGVNFVVNDEELKPKRVTMNLKDVKLHEALSGLADVLGAHWQTKGSMLVLRAGGGMAFSRAISPATSGSGFNYSIDQKRKMSDMARVLEDTRRGISERYRAPEMRIGSLKELIQSLTPAQKELHKKQGYLKWSDLTDAQRKLAEPGIEKRADQSFTFEIKIDKETWKIKDK